MAEKEKNQGVSSPDLNPILWRDLKRAVHKQMPTNLNELRQCCKESGTKFLHNDVRD